MLGFAILILIGGFLLSLPISNRDGQWLSAVDSIFTSTSAVCVTGLIVVDTAVQFTVFGQIVLLCLIQIGGLGIFLTKQIADDISYEYLNGENHLKITKKVK